MLAVLAALLASFAQSAAADAGAPTAVAGGPYFIAEGDSLALDASSSSDPETDSLTYQWDLDNDGQYDDASGLSPNVPWSLLAEVGVDDDGEYSVGLEVHDGTSTHTDTTRLSIANAAPTIVVSGIGTALVGEPYQVTMSVSDAGADTITSWSIAWGDGSVTTGPGMPGVANHSYSALGLTNDISAGVVDEDGSWITADIVVPYYDADQKVGRRDAQTGANVADLGSTGGSLQTAYGAAVGPNGDLYVSGNQSNTIERYDATTNAHLGTFVAPGAGGLTRPRGLAFGPDGNLYVASTPAGVLRYNGSTGAFIDSFAGTVTLNSATALSFGPDGMLYVTDGVDDNVERYDGGTGQHIDTFAALPGGSSPADLAWGPNGNLFVALYSSSSVIEVDASTGRRLGSLVDTGLTNPTGLRFGPDGQLWVADYWTDQINRFDAVTGAPLSSPASEPGTAGPRQFTFVPDHQVTVAGSLPDPLTSDQWRKTMAPDSPSTPLTFEENIGQASPSLEFIARGKGYIAVLTGGEAVLSLAGGDTAEAIRMRFVGGATNPAATGTDPAVGDGSAIGPQFSSVEYTDVYPGIDVTYSPNGRELEYTFVVTPGADPDAINIDFDGVRNVSLDQDGNLLIDAQTGPDLSSTAPVTYQEVLGTRVSVTSRYVLQPNGSVGIQLGGYDPAVPLIIDPTFQSVTSVSTGVASSTTITKPAVLSAGDIMIASVALLEQSSGIAVTPPAGWTLIREDIEVDAQSQHLYYKIATGSEPASYQFTYNQSRASVGAITAYAGVHAANPIDAHGGQYNSGTSPIAPSITTTVANATLIAVFANNAGAAITPPAGMTERWDEAGAIAIEGSDETLAGPGATGIRTSASSTGTTIGQLIALRPSPLAVVNSTGDSADATPGDGVCDTGGTNTQAAPECTLRSALEEANALAGTDLIEFDIPATAAGHSAGVWTISPSAGFPALTDAVTVDATTQPGWSATPIVEINGSGAGGASGFDLSAGSDASAIRGLAVYSFGGDGMSIGTSANTIVSNHIGTNASGGPGLGNGTAGIYVWSGSANQIGGTAAGLGNLIVGNADGIVLESGAGSGNSIVSNRISGNSLLGIDLNNDAVSINDAGDADTGPNDLLNHPVVASAVESGGLTTLSGTYDVPAGNYRFEFFKNPSGAGASGYGEGEQFAASSTLTHTGSGPEPWGAAFPGATGDIISITLTEDFGVVGYGSTSEFSASTTVTNVSNTAPSADAGGPYVISEGDPVTLDGSASTDPDADTLTYDWDLDNNGSYGDVSGVSPTLSWAILSGFGIDDSDSFTIGLRVDDSVSGSNATTTTINVANTAPTVSVTGSGSANPAQAYTVTLSAADPGNDTITSWTINWGDGNIDTLAGNPSSANHNYATKGSYNITAAVTDEDGTFIDSRLQVADFYGGDAEEYDAVTGAQIRSFPANPALVGPAEMAVGPDGLTYVSGFTSNNVVRYDPATGVFVDEFVAANSGGLTSAFGLAWTPEGDLLVTSYGTDSVLRFDGTSGAPLGQFVASGTGGLDGPIDITWTPAGDLLVSGWLSGDVIRYDGQSGAYLQTAVAGLSQATGLAFGPTGDLFVGHRNTGTVQRFDGSTWAPFGTFVSLPAPFGVVWGPDGNLWVASETTDVVNVYDPAGVLLRTNSDGTNGIDGPWMVDFTPDHQVLVEAFVVNSTGDAGDATPGDGQCTTGGVNISAQPECTLRAAIDEANAAADGDAVVFGIPVADPGHSGGVWTIAPGSQLPTIDETVVVDGTTQPGWTSTPVIELDGSGTGAFVDGLRVSADNVEVRGLAVNQFGGVGIKVIFGAANVLVAGNHVGLDPSGLVDRGNARWGIELQAGSGPTTVGGTSAADRNIVSGNGDAGLMIYASDANTIIGNYIGTDISGNAAVGNTGDGIDLANGSADNTIGLPGSGNVLSGNTNDGMELTDVTGPNTIQANLIGLGADGSTIVGNSRFGLVLYNGVNNTQVGGPGLGEGNVISGNASQGIHINGNGNTATTANVIEGNIIGLDPTGTFGLGNGSHGVRIFGGAHTNTVGGTTPGARNIISDNGGDGVWISGTNTDNNSVDGNYVGTNAAGDAALGNATSGVDIDLGASATVVGSAGVGNLLSGNGDAGVFVGDVTPGTIIHRNLIGTNAAGTDPIPNLWLGIALWGGPTGTQIGGLGAGEGNTIAYNAGHGVWLKEDAGVANPIRGNAIHSNGGLGIDLAELSDPGSGVTPNDPLDSDGGPNLGQNWPTLSSAITSVSNTTIVGNLSSAVATTYTVDFYSSPVSDPSGNGEGAVYLGSDTVLTSGAGDGAIATVLPVSVTTGHLISATATDPGGNTSEFGTPVVVTSAVAVVNSTADTGDTNPGDDLCSTGGINSDGDIECTLRAAIEEANASALVVDIHFAVPTSDSGHVGGAWTMSLTTGELPTITAGLGVDARTQPGFSTDPVMNLDGSGLVGTESGFVVGAASTGSTIAGFSITEFPGDGVLVLGDTTLIADNHLGVWVDGTTAAGNATEGIVVAGSANGTVIQANLIGDHFNAAIAVTNTSTGTVVVGNTIGTDTSLTVDLGNGQGVWANTTGSAIVGGTGGGDGNTIRNSTFDAVELYNSGPGVAVLSNSITDNAGHGIDLEGDGLTPNDPGDGDAGANDFLNFPEIVAVQRLGTSLVVEYTLDVPAGNYRIELFGSSAADVTGYGEAETFVGSSSIIHTGGGVETFTHTVTSPPTILTATATSDLGGGSFGPTSEFSLAVPSPDLVIVNSTGDSADSAAGDGQCDTGGTNADGDPECTLRAAIEEANDPTTPVDTIWFAIPVTDVGYNGGGWWTLAPGSNLPQITATVSIDATTQPGWFGSPVVEVDGTGAGIGARAFDLSAANVELRGLAIGNFDDAGVWVQVGGGTIAGNYIGVAADGTTAWGNTGEGIAVFNAATGTTIGGTGAADRNVIVGSGAAGIALGNADATGIIGNYIGVLPDGLTPLANINGVYVQDSAAVAIGGSAAGAGNVISGNTFQGIQLNVGSASATLHGNFIGVGADGSTSVSNGATGIHLLSTATNHEIGGLGLGEGNTIANNGGDGVLVQSTGVAPSVVGNSVSLNADLAIDFNDDGVTPNDAPDVDGIPNYPVLGGATAAGGSITLDYTLDVPAGTYRLEVFTNPSGADPSGFGEGEVLESSTSIIHTGSGPEAGSITFGGLGGDIISATATLDLGGGSYGSTSEFSGVVTAVTAVGAGVTDQTVRRSDALAGGGLDPAGTVAGAAGLALGFDGAGDRLIGPGVDLTAGALAMSGWINLAAMGTDPRIVAKTAAPGSTIYELLVDSATNEAVARVKLGATTYEARGGAVTVVSWHLVSAVWDGTDLRLYVDGNEVDSVAAAGSLDADVAVPLTVGNVESATRGVNGGLDHVQVQHRTVSADETAAYYANVNNPGAFVQVGAEQTSTPNPWTVSTAQSRSGSYSLDAPETSGADAAAWAVATGIDEPGVVFESWWWFTTDSSVDIAGGTRAGVAPTDQFEASLNSPSGWELRRRQGTTESVDAAAAGTTTTGGWVQVEVWTDQNGDTRILIDGTETTRWTAQGSALTSGSVALRAAALPLVEDWYIDDAQARKLVIPEPLTSLGPLDRN